MGQVSNAPVVQKAGRLPTQAGNGSASLTLALHSIEVRPVPFVAARDLLVRHHYRHSWPGGTQLAFGVFVGKKLMGAITFGVGSANGHQLVKGAKPADCLTLSRLWLSDELPKNSESRVLGILLRGLKRHTQLKFLISYADPTHGHVGGIYKSTAWVYSGLSDAMPLYDVGDGVARHSRSLSHAYGTHSLAYFRDHDVDLKIIAQAAKHRYLYFLDPAWRQRLRVPELPYPKKEASNESD